MRIFSILIAVFAFSVAQAFGQQETTVVGPDNIGQFRYDVVQKDGTTKTVTHDFTKANDQNGSFSANTESKAGNVAVASNAEGGPVMEFPETKHDFGKIKEGEVVKHVFKFKNSGDAPLKLVSVKGSCGCTVPTYPREDIAPGAEAEINVKFNSKGRVGKQTKTVTIRTNEEGNSMHILTITGEVFRPDAANHEGGDHSGHDHSGHDHSGHGH